MTLDHLILSARSWWCEPGEPIVWAFPDPYHIPLFEVDGLDEHGKRRRNILTRAAFQVGSLPFRINSLMTWGDEPADQRNLPTAVVAARGADATAVRMTGTQGEASPGELPGVLVATPGRLALLELTEIPEGSKDWFDKGLEKIKKATGPAYQLADDFAGTMGSTINNKGRYFDHDGQTRTPQVVERANVGTEQISGYGVVPREFRGHDYDKDNRSSSYLRINFADGSRLELRIPAGTDPNRVLGLVRGNGVGSW
ncbi:hypothetical protein [Saccharopolyspora sp. ASAGF58]|uniref:hypothetical protein n=1 Tax=Saccharopolyspora sp. ASAGF58 TaxID=2719023 RepID=UPI00143FFBD3|nr:hypothetical protein [Saccharopolyspora sp. ASAGF58]QIZ34470.1 hypothetical protein FDZ84_06665 [Saccharopolyspora sp. ASAGF58]